MGASWTKEAPLPGGDVGNYNAEVPGSAIASDQPYREADLAIDFCKERLVFVGDSPNDQPMFAFFPNAVGVANVREMADLMETLPRYVAPSCGSAGFAEAAEALLAARCSRRPTKR